MEVGPAVAMCKRMCSYVHVLVYNTHVEVMCNAYEH